MRCWESWPWLPVLGNRGEDCGSQAAMRAALRTGTWVHCHCGFFQSWLRHFSITINLECVVYSGIKQTHNAALFSSPFVLGKEQVI